MRKITYIILSIIFVPLVVLASPFDYETCNLGWKHVHHEHNEESYQKAWCNAHNGVMEYENSIVGCISMHQNFMVQKLIPC